MEAQQNKPRPMKCIVVGSGVVGGKLLNILAEKKHQVLAIANSNQVRWGPDDQKVSLAGYPDTYVMRTLAPFCTDADVAFVAISTKDKGESARDYINFFLSRGVAVVTAEKGALAYHYAELSPNLQQIGCSATFGGGTDMLECLRRRHLRDHDGVSIKLVVNGTMNYILSGIGGGHSFQDVLAEAIRRGYAEPGDGAPVDKINGELSDVCLKASVFYNVVLAKRGEYLTPQSIRVTPLTEIDLYKLVESENRFRYVLSASSLPASDSGNGADPPGSIVARIGRWTIRGGFYDIGGDNDVNRWLQIVRGVDNGFYIHSADDGDTGYSHAGPGAGPVPTAMAMYRDAMRLTENRDGQTSSPWPSRFETSPLEDACDAGHRSPDESSHLNMVG